MKKVQRINESQLRAIVAESVKRVLNEASVVAGTNIPRKGSDSRKTENTSAPDFVQTWADRFEKRLNSIAGVANAFDVVAHVDNIENVDSWGDWFTDAESYTFYNHANIVFSVSINHSILFGAKAKPSKIANIIHNVAYQIFGNIEDSELTFNLDRFGEGEVTLSFIAHEEEYGCFGNEIKDNPLFTHNKSRQIPRKGSAFREYDED